jgi:hypothetical protein
MDPCPGTRWQLALRVKRRGSEGAELSVELGVRVGRAVTSCALVQQRELVPPPPPFSWSHKVAPRRRKSVLTPARGARQTVFRPFRLVHSSPLLPPPRAMPQDGHLPRERWRRRDGELRIIDHITQQSSKSTTHGNVTLARMSLRADTLIC